MYVLSAVCRDKGGALLSLASIFTIVFLHFLLSFSSHWEDTSITQAIVWPHIQTLQSSTKKTSTAHSIFNSLLSVWKWGRTWSFMFHILLHNTPDWNKPVNSSSKSFALSNLHTIYARRLNEPNTKGII